MSRVPVCAGDRGISPPLRHHIPTSALTSADWSAAISTKRDDIELDKLRRERQAAWMRFRANPCAKTRREYMEATKRWQEARDE